MKYAHRHHHDGEHLVAALVAAVRDGDQEERADEISGGLVRSLMRATEHSDVIVATALVRGDLGPLFGRESGQAEVVHRRELLGDVRILDGDVSISMHS